MVPKVDLHKKQQKKEVNAPAFLYSNMVKIRKIRSIKDHYRILEPIGQGDGYTFKAVGVQNAHIRAVKHIEKQRQGGLTKQIEMEFAILKTLV